MAQYIIPALIGLVGIVAGAWIQGAWNRRKVKAESIKDEADANEQIRETVMALIDPLKTRITEQDKKIDDQNKVINDLKIELQDWKDWANALVQQLKSLGCHEPVPFKSSKGK
jgi:uncharacterized coiled-coil protein SlyX